MANQLAKAKTNFALWISSDAMKEQVNKAMAGKDGTRFVSSIISAVQANPALQECTNASIFSGALLGESLKLSPSPQLGQYYLVPYKKKKKTVDPQTGREIWTEESLAQFQIGYKGMLQLAIRSGYYKKINVLPIKEGELIRFNPLEEEIEVRLIEDEEERENAKTIGYYAMFEYLNGFRKALYWSKNKMLKHADRYSMAFSKDATGKKVSFEDYEAGKYNEKDAWMYSSFWYKDFDEMANKTMLRQLISKWGIMSIELQNAFEADQAVINEDGTKDYVDNDEMIIDEPVPEVHDPLADIEEKPKKAKKVDEGK